MMEINFLRKQIRETFDHGEPKEASLQNLIKINDWLWLGFINDAQGDELAEYNSEIYKRYQ